MLCHRIVTGLEAATALHYHWIAPVVTAASILTSGAMLRAAGRIFLGLGATSEPYLSEEPDEQREVEREPGRSQSLMLVPTATLALAGIGLSLVPGLERHSEAAAARFRDTHAYVDGVLNGHQPHHAVLDFALLKLPTPSVLWGLASALGAVLLAIVALNRERLRPAFVKAPLRVLNAGL